jgi:hypothetical protein
MPEETIACPACGAPSYPEAGKTHIPCAYCGANLTIPEALRMKANPSAEKISTKPQPFQVPEMEASDILRKAQPLAIRAWNLYAYWTWLRWALPACLTILVVGILTCAALGMIPVVWSLLR